LKEETATDLDQFETLQRMMQERLGSDPQAIGAERLFRLPGFYHWKDENEPFLCGLVHTDYSKKYSIGELVHKFGGQKRFASLKRKSAVGKYSGKPIQLDDFQGMGHIDNICNGCQVFKKLQNKKGPTHNERLALLWTYTNLGNQGLEQLRRIAKGWNDYNEEVTESNIDYAVTKGYFAPTCDWLIKQGVCPGRCINIRHYRKPFDLYDHPIELLPIPFKNRNIINSSSIQFKDDSKTITAGIVNTLQKRSQTVSMAHRKALINIAKTVISPIYNDKPIIIPAIPGLGKTTFILSYLNFMLANYTNFGAVVVVERQKTIDELAEKMNERSLIVDFHIDLGYDRAYPMIGYNRDDCKKRYKQYKPSQCKTCTIPFSDCRVKYNFTKQQHSPVVIISHSRLFQMSDKDDLLGALRYWQSKGKKHKRSVLLIDERPQLVENVPTDSTMWDTLLSDVQQYTPDYYSEVLSAVNLIRDNYSSAHDYKQINITNTNFRWTTDFTDTWTEAYLGDYPEYPYLLANIIKEGGLYNKQDHTVTTTHYSNTYWQDYSTFVYDGTASVDFDYRNDCFYFLDVPQLKPYHNLTLNICMETSLSKTFYQNNPDFIKEFCGDIKRIAKTGETYVVCYKYYEPQYEKLLEGQSNISIEHYGNTKGANHLIKNVNLICTGILNKGEPYYLSKTLAIYNDNVGFDVITTDRVRRFKDINAESIKVYEMVTELVQEIFRTQLRNHSSEADINVYLCTRDVNLINSLQDFFEGCNVKRDWVPKALLGNRELFRYFVEEHNNEFNTKTKLVKAFLDQGHSLNSTDIVDVLGVDKSNAAKYLH